MFVTVQDWKDDPMMQKEYQQKIIELLCKIDDIPLLDLILQLLQKSQKIW